VLVIETPSDAKLHNSTGLDCCDVLLGRFMKWKINEMEIILTSSFINTSMNLYEEILLFDESEVLALLDRLAGINCFDGFVVGFGKKTFLQNSFFNGSCHMILN
jgi:hypothetical protein